MFQLESTKHLTANMIHGKNDSPYKRGLFKMELFTLESVCLWDDLNEILKLRIIIHLH